MWKYWQLDPETTNAGAFGVKSIGQISLGWNEDPTDIDTLTAFVRWDGCTIIDDNRPRERHICDLDDEIGRWQELRDIALGYFGGDFCVGTLTDEAVQEYIRGHHRVVEGSLAQNKMLRGEGQQIGEHAADGHEHIGL